MKTFLILGAGTAGTMMAHKLDALLSPEEWRIVVVDQDDRHLYQPGLLFVPFGMARPEDLVRSRSRNLPPRAELRLSAIESIDPEARIVRLSDGEELTWDLLLIATGTRILPEETPGLTGEGWHKDAFDFYSLEGATALRDRLASWAGGTLVVNFVDVPIKCPVAPLEFAFLADAFFRERGMRDAVRLVYATPLEGAFTKPRASAALGQMLGDRGIEVVSEFGLASVDGGARRMTAFDGRTLDYDLLVTIPLHGGAHPFQNSTMGDALGFIPTDKRTLRSRDHEHIFVIGDATDVPASKAGSVAHFQGDVLVENIRRHLAGLPLLADFDGHANCFIESGDGKALLIDFNYETEPLPGKFPLPVVGPFDLLAESHVNHWGKLAFEWIYWNILIRGGEMPIEHRMSLMGKRA